MCDAFTPSSGGMVRSPEDEFHNEKTSPIRLRPLAARKKLFSEETGRKYEEAKNDDQVTVFVSLCMILLGITGIYFHKPVRNVIGLDNRLEHQPFIFGLL